MVRQLGVDYAQGYHIGKPVPLSEILSLKGDSYRLRGKDLGARPTRPGS